MTVATSVSENTYVSNGTTTVYAFTFPTLLATDLVVQLVATNSIVTTLTLNTGYTVQNAGFEAGGSITLTAAPAAGTRVVIKREVPYTQPTDYKNQGSFYPATHERSFDRATMQIQQLRRAADNSMQLVPGANGEFVWDARGSRIINVAAGVADTDAANVGQGGGGGGGGSNVGVSLYWQFTGNGTTVDFNIAGADVSSAIYYDVAVGGVVQNPGVNFSVIVGADVAGSLLRFATPPPNGVTIWVVLRGSTSAAAQLVTPQIPVFTIPGTTATIDATYRTGLIVCTSASPVTLTIRTNTGSPTQDWFSGDYFSVKQLGAGAVTVTGPTIDRPTGLAVRTRVQNSVISLVLDNVTTNRWTAANDLATAP